MCQLFRVWGLKFSNLLDVDVFDDKWFQVFFVLENLKVLMSG